MTEDDSSDTELVYDDMQPHCHQEPLDLTQTSPQSLASLPRRPRALPRHGSFSDSEASVDGGDKENPFMLLQQQLMKLEREKIGLKDSHMESCLEAEAQSRQANDDGPHRFSTASPDDWPACDDDWDNECEENALPPSMARSKQNQSKVVVASPLSKCALRELERSRKRLRKSFDFPKEISQGRIVTPLTESASALTSIAGTRPQHWVSGRSMKLERIGIRKSDAYKTPSSKRSLQLATATRAPFSLEIATRNTTKQSTKAFTPSFLGKQLNGNTDCEVNDNEEPWYQRTKTNQSGKRNSKTSSKRKTQGPLMQKYTKLRAAMSADILRLQSRMSMQDPRKDKPYIDVQLVGGSTPLLERHVVVLGKIDEANLAWIVLEKSICGPCVLRVYNPIQLRMEHMANNNGVATVVICTRFHEVLL